MSYIGPEPTENYASFQTETFSVSATTSYTLAHSVANENELALFINNVRQQPGSGKAYTASGTALTLSAATATTDTMYAIYLGRALQTSVPHTNSVTSSMLGSNFFTGATDIGGAIADADLMLLDDGAGGTLRKSAMSRVRTYATDCALISSTTMSGTASTVNITSGIDSTYSIYKLWYINVSAEGAGNTLFMKISSNGGSSFIGSGYIHTGFEANYTGSGSSSSVQGANGFVQLGNNIANYDDNTTEGSCGYVEFYTPSVSRKPVFTGLSSQFSDDGDADAYYWGGHYATATTINAIQIGGSNNLHGTLKLYGYK